MLSRYIGDGIMQLYCASCGEVVAEYKCDKNRIPIATIFDNTCDHICPDERLYNQAMGEMSEFVQDVMKQCIDFADKYCYEIEWVLEKFQEEFSRAKNNK